VSPPASIVLVHGAWHGAWCFDSVAPPLRDRGLDVVALDLPGHGADRGALGDLHDDARWVTSVLDRVGGDIVLVGHSYGGAVITEAGTHPSVRHLVYLAAFSIDGHETCGSAAADDPDVQSLSHDGRPDLGEALVWVDDGVTALDPSRAAELLFNRCAESVAADAIARLGPQRMEALAQSPTAVAWRDRPSTYAVCTNDQIVHPGLQRILARRCSHQASWPTDHSPFLSRPDLVIELLDDLARSVTSSPMSV
jgi:pimeloyl-ACP methyl ester carboxylesterase